MNYIQVVSNSAFGSSGLEVRGHNDQDIGMRKSIMDVLIHRVPSVFPSPSVGEAKHDLCPLSHEEAFAQFVYGPPHELSIGVVMLCCSHEQVVGIQAGSYL